MLIVAREVACRRVRHRWRFRFEHLPAESNTIADSLSRLSAVPAKPFPKEAAHAIQRTSPTWPQLFRARTLLSQDQCVSEKQCKIPVASSVQRGAFSTISIEFTPIWCFFAFCVLRLWVCSHPLLFAFSQQILSGLSLHGVSVRCSVARLWVCFDLCLLIFSRHILPGLFSPEILRVAAQSDFGFGPTRVSLRCPSKSCTGFAPTRVP